MPTRPVLEVGKSNFVFLSDVFASILLLAEGDMDYFAVGLQCLKTRLMTAKVHSYGTLLESLWILHPLDTALARISQWDLRAPSASDYDMISAVLSAQYSWLKHVVHLGADFRICLFFNQVG